MLKPDILQNLLSRKSVDFNEFGLRLYLVNFVPWNEIQTARLIRIPYFNYILIKNSRRRLPFFFKTWWVPLYLNDVTGDILKHAPQGHPVRKLFE